MVGHATRGRAVPQDQHRDDAASAAGQGRRHRQHRRVPVLGGRQFHQRPDDRRRRRLEFDEVPVGLRAELGMGGPVSWSARPKGRKNTVNLFALLDQAAARFGDRGAVYLGEQPTAYVERAARPGAAAGRRRCASFGPGARVAVASENRPEIVELMFAHLGRRMRVRADQLQAASARDAADPRGRRRRTGFRVTEDRRGAGTGHRRAHRGHRQRRVRRPVRLRAPRSPPCTDPADVGVAVLHQRHHRPVEGRDAVAPQPDGDDRRPPRRFRLRPTRTAAWCTARRCRTVRASTSRRTCCAAPGR